MNGKGYVNLITVNNGEVKITLQSLLASNCNVHKRKDCDYVFLTKEILDKLSDDQVLLDFYGNEDKVLNFKKQDHWKNTTQKGGASIYGAKVISE